MAAARKVPIRLKMERPGYLLNTVQRALGQAATDLWAEGMASAEDIELGIISTFGFRMPHEGPMKHYDLAGLWRWPEDVRGSWASANEQMKQRLANGRPWFIDPERFDEALDARDREYARRSQGALLDGHPRTKPGTFVPLGASGCRQAAFDEMGVLKKVSRGQEFPCHPHAAGLAKTVCEVVVVEEHANRSGHRVQVARVIDQETFDMVVDLVLDAADSAGDDRTALPHRFGHGQTEALAQALLDDHAGVTLEGVDDRGVLVGVGHRQRREMHPPFECAGSGCQRLTWTRALPPPPGRRPRR